MPISPSPSSSSLHSDSTVAGSKGENVKVTVRVRPLTPSEERENQYGVWDVDALDCTVRLSKEFAERNKKLVTDFRYDQVFMGSNNAVVYSQSVKNLVWSCMEGYNGTVFAYGQTSSGKTYTMTGTEFQPGVIPQAVEDVFAYIHQSAGKREFLLRVSYMEIYNESVRDLLSPETRDLRIHEDKKRGVYVSPLKEEIVTTPKQVMRVIQRGESNRHVSTTDYNEHSSRSHTIFQMVIESRDNSSLSSPAQLRKGGKGSNAVRISLLNLIDLAGSEKASSNADRRKEGAYINRSLLTLGTVISKLTEEKGSHIPFRDSKLTRILQSSLSGNALVSVICTMSPSYVNVDESANTLKFAARVKRIVTRATTNQILDDKALLQKYRLEIAELKEKLMMTNELYEKQKQQEIAALKQEKEKFEEEIAEQQLLRTALKERIDHLTRLILTSSSINAKSLGTTSISSSNMITPGMGSAASQQSSQQSLQYEKERLELINHELIQKDVMIQKLHSENDWKDRYMSRLEPIFSRILQSEFLDHSQLSEIKSEIASARDHTVHQSPNKANQDQNNVGSHAETPGNKDEELMKLRNVNREMEIILKEQEEKITQLQSMISGGNPADNTSRSTSPVSSQTQYELQLATQRIQELESAITDSEDFIRELSTENREFKTMIMELKNKIRKMELSQFENAEVATSQPSTPSSTIDSFTDSLQSSQNQAPTIPRRSSKRDVETTARLREAEYLLEKERKLRLEEQSKMHDRIASLEAELTITKAELSVAQLVSNFSPGTSFSPPPSDINSTTDNFSPIEVPPSLKDN